RGGGVGLTGGVGGGGGAVPPLHRPVRALPGEGDMTTAADRIDPALRAEALASLLIERGLVDQATMDNFIKTYEQSVGPMNGAKRVARAWTDPGYAERLPADGTAALPQL